MAELRAIRLTSCSDAVSYRFRARVKIPVSFCSLKFVLSMGKRYLTIEEAAAHLGITPEEMMELRNRGKILRILDRGTWKFDVDDVTELARTRASQATPSSVDVTESAEPTETIAAAVSTPALRESLEPVLDVDQLRRELLARPSPITSRAIIDYLSVVCRVTGNDAESVVDGFWNYAIDMAHYKDRRSLVIPHFGSFTLRRLGDQTGLAFTSRPVDSIRQRLDQRRGRTASERWIDYFQRSGDGDATRLSVKRRMAVRIASETQRDLRLVHRVLWELFDVVCEIFASGEKKIRWAMRGEMAPVSWRDESWYDFRCYRRLSARLPDWAETQEYTGRAVSRTTEIKHERRTSPRTGHSRKTPSRQTQDTGCLVTVLVTIIALAGVLAVAV